MKIYIASSWKNTDRCDKLKDALEARGIDVSLFSFPGHRSVEFQWSELQWKPGQDVVAYMNHYQVVKDAYYDDRTCLDGCDAVIMVFPAGVSAHLELGTALGQNKPTFIYGDLSTMRPEVWYMGVNGIYWDHELDNLISRLSLIMEIANKTT